MCLSFVHQPSHPHVGTCTLGTFASNDLCWSTSYVNSGWSNTLGKEYDPKITTKRSVSWKVMATGQKMLDRSVLKIEQEIKEPAVTRNLFWLWFPGGGGGSTRQPAGALCSAWHSGPCCGKTGTGRMVSTLLGPKSWLPLRHSDERHLYIKISSIA